MLNPVRGQGGTQTEPWIMGLQVQHAQLATQPRCLPL